MTRSLMSPRRCHGRHDHANEQQHDEDHPDDVHGIAQADPARLAQLVTAAGAGRRLVRDFSATRRTLHHSHAAPPHGGYTRARAVG